MKANDEHGSWPNGKSGQFFYQVGVCFVVLGGLVAAVASPLDIFKGSWLAAYLVLVCGVSLAALGRAQALFPRRPVSVQIWRIQFVAWIIGNAFVIAGTMDRKPLSVVLGGILLLVVLGLALWVLREGVRNAWGWAYVSMLLILTVSVPIGLILAHLRN